MARTIAEVESRLAVVPPGLDKRTAERAAAVALVLRESRRDDGRDDLEALFIRRAVHESDPWSGHLAFPGGRIDPEDADARAAAERETAEELALDLGGARPVGRLNDVFGYAESIRVSAFVYALDGSAADPPLRPNYEVQEAFWSPLHHCDDVGRQEMREFSYLEHSMRLPTIRLLEDERAPVLWGITYKFMDDFMKAIGRPIPYMPWEEHNV